MRYGMIFLGVIISATSLIAHAAPADEAERLRNEITNLRALPFGFAAWCDTGTLRMNQEGRAGFRVSNSAICRLVPDGDFVCTTDPYRQDQPDGSLIDHCHELQEPKPGDGI